LSSAVPASGAILAETTRHRVTTRLLPFLMLVYLFAYIDRANLSIAKLQMQGDLHFDDTITGLGAGIFFIGYFFLEVPATLVVERWSARRLLSGIMVTWGLVATLTGFIGLLATSVSVVKQFYALRFLLGIAESGFFPGVIVFLSHWFRYEDRARAKTYFMLTQPLAILIGYAVSRWILESVHPLGLPGWRWVFILEGLPSIALGIFSFFYLTDWPPDARWLTPQQRNWLTNELHNEHLQRTAACRVSITASLREPYTLLLILIYFLIVSANQALIFFLPSVVDGMKQWSLTIRSTIPLLPYALGIFTILFAGLSAQRTGERRWHTAAPMLLCGIAMVLAIMVGNNPLPVIAFLCLAAGTSQAYLPSFWTIPTAYLGKSAAATAIGLGFVGPYAFGYLKTATGGWNVGLWFIGGCCFVAGLLATLIRVGQNGPVERTS
jgi:ACS family tartrate transporter-like MFS transporter